MAVSKNCNIKKTTDNEILNAGICPACLTLQTGDSERCMNCGFIVVKILSNPSGSKMIAEFMRRVLGHIWC